MTPYEQLRGNMDARVESDLGDSISYSIGGAPPQTIFGFVIRSGDEGGLNGMDPLPVRWFIKASWQQLPQRPGRTDRLTHPRLPGTMRPAVDSVSAEGEHWIFELQKAP